MLSEYLRGLDWNVIHTREPGGIAIGNKIRAVSLCQSPAITGLTELMLYSADRARRRGRLINPVLEKGGVVVCGSRMQPPLPGICAPLTVKTMSLLSAIATRMAEGRTLRWCLTLLRRSTRARQRNCSSRSLSEAPFEEESLEMPRSASGRVIRVLRLLSRTG